MGRHQSHRCSGKIKPFIKHAHSCTQTHWLATSESQLGFQTGQGSTCVPMHNKGPFFLFSTYLLIFSSEQVSTGSCFHKTYPITSTLFHQIKQDLSESNRTLDKPKMPSSAFNWPESECIFSTTVLFRILNSAGESGKAGFISIITMRWVFEQNNSPEWFRILSHK